MADYRREIIYLEKNENGRHNSECGYVRLEKRKDRLNVYLMVKDFCQKEVQPVYLVVEKEDGLSLWPIGDVSGENVERRYALWMHKEKICGVLIGTKVCYLYGRCQGNSADFSIAFLEKVPESAEKPESETNPVEVSELPGQEPEKTRDEFLNGLSEMYPFEDDEMEWCLQMQPSDFSSFPMPYWHYAKNSFLLHGFYNYRHLLYAHSKGKNYVGVPGQFHRRDQYLAARFGFPRFKATQKKNITLGDFGYWMKEL